MKNTKAMGLLLTSNVISGFAQGISMLSIPWYFTSVLKQETLFGYFYGAVTLATVFWSLYSGSLIDKYSRKTIFISISIGGALILGSVAAMGFHYGYVPIWMICLVFAGTVFIYNVHYPALYAFAQEITEKADYGKVNSQIEIQGQATTVFAGAVGAIMLTGAPGGNVSFLGATFTLPFEIGKWELQEIFLLDCITYLISILLIYFITYTPALNIQRHTGTVLDRIKVGFSYLKEHPLIFIFGNASHSIFVILLVEVHLLLPWYVNNHLNANADVYAGSEIFYSIGALMAGLGIRQMFKNQNVVSAIIILMTITTGIMWVVSFSRSVPIFFVFSLLIGLTNAGARVLRVTYLFERIPNNVIGRTSSVFSVINILLRAMFIGIFSIPFFSKGSNVTWAYFIGGLFILISIVPLILNYKKLVEEHG